LFQIDAVFLNKYLELWSKNNSMNINIQKNKRNDYWQHPEKNPPALLYVSRNAFTTVKCFKVLGINISDDLRWDAHIHALCAKTATRLYFLKILKCSGLAVEDFLCFYKCVICAVVKYSCIVWHHSVTAGQSD